MEPGAGNRPEILPNLQLDELLAELHGRLQAVIQTRDRMRGLLEAVVAIGSGLDLESTLRRIVETAVGLVDATYGALGVIGDGKRLAEFIPVGLTDEEIARIHHWPQGRGLLGLLIDDPRPLRLADIAGHPGSWRSKTRGCTTRPAGSSAGSRPAPRSPPGCCPAPSPMRSWPT